MHEFYDIRLLGRFLTPCSRGKIYEGKFIKKKEGEGEEAATFRGPRNSSRAVDNVFYFSGDTLLLSTVVISLRSPHYLPYPFWEDFILEEGKGSVVETLGEIRSSSRRAFFVYSVFPEIHPPVIKRILFNPLGREF